MTLISRVLKRGVILLSALMVAGTAYSPAIAQRAIPCAARTEMLNLLKGRYNEMPRAVGVISSRGVMEVYVSKEGTWSILMTSGRGKTCIIAAGKHWEDLQLAFKDPAA